MSQKDPNIITGSTLDGGTGMQAVEDSLKANDSTNAGTSYPSYAVAGTKFYHTTNNTLEIYDGSSWILISGGQSQSIQSFADGDATPSVSGGVTFKTANTSSTTITGFDDGYEGQKISVRAADANTIIDSGLTKTGMEIPLVSGDVLEFIYDGSSWQQISGSVGMGQFVTVSPPETVTDWIATTDITYQDVDLSTQIRKGASSVVLITEVVDSTSSTYLYMRANGDTTTTSRTSGTGVSTTVARSVNTSTVALDYNAILEAKYEATVDGGTAKIAGYYI